MKATDPITWRIDRPAELQVRLANTEWPPVFIGGGTAYVICPLCMAMVPAAAGRSPRIRHTQWHVVMAKLLEDLEQPPAHFRALVAGDG